MVSILDVNRVIDVVGSSRPLLSLSYEDPISGALKKLESAQVFGAIVHSGPVVVGVIDMQDIVRSLMKFTRTGAKDFSAESIKNLADEGKMFTQQVVGAILTPENLVRITGSSPLCEAISKMVDANVRRLVVVDELGKAVNIITQFDVVKFLYENLHEFGDTCLKNVGSLSIGSSPVICASLYQCVAEAFHLMVSKGVRSIGIVNNKADEVEELVANLSLTDLKGLTEQNFKNLSRSVFEFLLTTQETPKPIISCTNSTSFQDILAEIVNNKIHRVYVVDRLQRPKSVISLVDVLSFATQVL